MLGDQFSDRISFTAQKTGTPPTPTEAKIPTPFKAGPPPKSRALETVDDDQLAEAAAIELARLEQEHQPADLIGA